MKAYGRRGGKSRFLLYLDTIWKEVAKFRLLPPYPHCMGGRRPKNLYRRGDGKQSLPLPEVNPQSSISKLVTFVTQVTQIAYVFA
jgi:hypothetical protein